MSRQILSSSPLQLTDVLSAGTAANVVSNYVIELNYKLLLLGSMVFFAVCLAMVASFHRKRRNLSSVVCSVVLLAILGCGMNQQHKIIYHTYHKTKYRAQRHSTGIMIGKCKEQQINTQAPKIIQQIGFL